MVSKLNTERLIEDFAMQTQHIRMIENCFSTKAVALDNLSKPTSAEMVEFMSALDTYRMQGHVELYARLHNEGYFMDKLEAETGCPF